jgi:hypothetical protein
MNGITMIASTMPGGEHADAQRRTRRTAADNRQRRPCSRRAGADVLGQERRQHEQAPHAVDDRRDPGQQLDRRAERPRSHFGATSVRNIAMPKLTGTAISIAMAVTSVP